MDYIGHKYIEVPQTPQSQEDFADPKQLYCICREPFDPTDSRPEKVMFRCFLRWTLPEVGTSTLFCFGDTQEQIKMYLQKEMAYYCSFCSKDLPSNHEFRRFRERFQISSEAANHE